jgi:hypothetical protein
MLSLTLEEMHAIRDHFADPAHRAGPPRRRGPAALAHRRRAGVHRPDLVRALQAQDLRRAACATPTSGAARADRRPLQDLHQGRHHRGRRSEGRLAGLGVLRQRGRHRFDDDYHVLFKVETHNSPPRWTPTAARSPASSASTATPSAPAWAARCCATPGATASARPFYDGDAAEGLMHPRRIRDGVHQRRDRRRQPERHSRQRAASSASTTASSASRWSSAARWAGCRSRWAAAERAQGVEPGDHRHGGRPHRQGRHPRRDLLLRGTARRDRPRRRCRSATPSPSARCTNSSRGARPRACTAR